MRAFLKNKNDLGKLMILVGFLTLVPVIVLPFYSSEAKYFIAFFIPAIVSVVLGFIVCFFARPAPLENSYFGTIKRGSLTVLFAWIYGIIVGAIPFVFLGDLTFVQCLFESASGWTTTGFSVVDLQKMPHIYLFHRSFMQFCGGLGFILMMAMVIQNKHSMNLFNFEGHSDQLSPSVIKTARTVFRLYFCIYVVGVFLLFICGMPLFDSIVHCMGALSTGGFASRASMLDYNSVLLEGVTMLIMILGMTNFAVLLLLARRKFKQIAKVSEVRFTALVFAVVIPIVAISIYLYGQLSFMKSAWRGAFNIISALSTTGFSVVEYSALPPVAVALMILMMLIGGAAGSTSGGIKLNRVYLLFRGAGISVGKKLTCENGVDARHYFRAQGKCDIDNTLLRDTYAYTFLYILIFIAIAILFCITSGAGLSAAVFESAALSGTAGISAGILTSGANSATLIVGIIGMIIARLEINIIITGACSIFLRR